MALPEASLNTNLTLRFARGGGDMERAETVTGKGRHNLRTKRDGENSFALGAPSIVHNARLTRFFDKIL